MVEAWVEPQQLHGTYIQMQGGRRRPPRAEFAAGTRAGNMPARPLPEHAIPESSPADNSLLGESNASSLGLMANGMASSRSTRSQSVRQSMMNTITKLEQEQQRKAFEVIKLRVRAEVMYALSEALPASCEHGGVPRFGTVEVRPLATPAAPRPQPTRLTDTTVLIVTSITHATVLVVADITRAG